MKITIGLLCVAALAGCANVSDVVPTGPGTYMLVSNGIAGNGSGAAQLANAIQKAGNFCSSQRKQMKIIHSGQIEPMFGRAPSGQVDFSCD